MSAAFNPFYERFFKKRGFEALGKILFAGFLSLTFFLPYFYFVGIESLHNWSWLLALLITSALLFLHYSTAILFDLFPTWSAYIEEDRSEIYQKPLNRYLSDRNFLLAALFFGILNVVMGIIFGIDQKNPAASIILLYGYFLAGFVCGLPAMGIFGVVATIREFTKTTDLKLDFTAPDRCGGLSFVGSALVKFSVVTLLEGVLIASYILLADWTRSGQDWVQLVMWSWIVFPFLLSLLVLILPSIDLNRMLSRYRLQTEQTLKKKCSALRKKIEQSETDPTEREKWRVEYEYHCKRREEVYRMRNWPFSAGATTSFIGAFLSNLIIAIELAKAFIKS